MTAPQTIVDLEDGCVRRDGRLVLDHVRLRVGAEDVVAVLGPNGAGKSTLVRAILRLQPLASGTLQLFGVPIQRFHDWNRIGWVPQRTNASGGVPATVEEVVATGRLGRTGFARRFSSDDKAAIATALDVVNLTARRTDSVATLSGGQQQRVLIARALAGNPELLVLDEPTAGVDAESQDAFARALGRLAETGTTVVLVAHELGPLAALVSRTVELRDGRVVYEGPARAPEPFHDHPDHDHVHPHAHGADETPALLRNVWRGA